MTELLLMLNCKSKINDVDDFGFSPLSFALISGNVDMIHLLVDNGAAVNNSLLLRNEKVEEKMELYPLHLAVWLTLNPSFEVIKTLLDLNASLINKDFLGRTPLHYAIIVEDPILRKRVFI